MKKIFLPFLFLLLAAVVHAQPSTNLVRRGLDANKGSTCTLGSIYTATDTGHMFLCPAGTWVDFGTGSGGGTVASVSVTTANGFSGTVANATTTPAITINNPTALVATTSVSSPIHTSSAAMVIKPGADSASGVQFQTSGGTPFFTLNTSFTNGSGITGQVVIGNTGAIGSANVNGQLEVVETGTGFVDLHGVVLRNYTDSVNNISLDFYKARGTPASPTPVLNGDNVGSINWWGRGTSTSVAAGRIRVVATEDWTDTAVGDDMTFLTDANGTMGSNNRLSMTLGQEGIVYLGNRSLAAPFTGTLSGVQGLGSNITGGDTVVQSGAGTGTGPSGTFRVKVAAAGTTGSSLNAYADALTIDSTKLATFPGAVTITGAATVKSLQPASNGTTAIQVFKADGTTNILDVDSTNARIGIGTAAPDAIFSVNKNTATFATSANSVTVAHFQGGDAGLSRIQNDSFGGQGSYEGRRHDGTAASPTAVVTNDVLVSLAGLGNRAAGTSMSGAVGEFRVNAAENYAPGTTGTYLSFLTTLIGTATTTEKMRLTDAGNLSLLGGKISTYNNITTAGWGVPAIYGSGRATAQVAANASVATYTVGAADGSFEVSANVLVTTATTHAFTVTCTYTDEGNTSRTLTLTFSQLAGTLITSITNAAGTVPYEGVPLHIRCRASTAITIATTGTFTAVVYNVEGIIRQLS